MNCCGAELTQEPLTCCLTLKSMLSHSSKYLQGPSLRLSRAFLCLFSSSSNSSWWDPWLLRRGALQRSACPHLQSQALVWGRAEPLSPSSVGSTFEREFIYVLWQNLYLRKNLLWAGMQVSCSLHVCICTHQERVDRRKHRLWNTTKHPANDRYSSGRLLGEVTSVMASSAFWQSKARAQLLMLKIDKTEKKGCDSGGFVIILTCLIMEKLKQVQALLFSFKDQPMEHHPPSRGSWLLFIPSGLWSSFHWATVPQELAGLPTPFGSSREIRQPHPYKKGQSPRYIWREKKNN